jgi:hypothetical protein
MLDGRTLVAVLLALLAAASTGCLQKPQTLQKSDGPQTNIRELQPGRRSSFTWIVYNEDGRDSLFWCVPPTKHSPKPQCLKVQMMEVKATQTICIPAEDESEETGRDAPAKSGKR